MSSIFKFLYYLFIKNLPNSYFPGGIIFNSIRVFIVKRFIKMGQGCKIQNNVYLGSNVQIGNYCQINEHVKLINVCIGDYVLIAPGVTIIGVDHEQKDINIPIALQGEIRKRIVIEDDVWIGTNAIILKGVHIKHGAIIGAGAVVVKNCEEYCIYGGVPAKLLKSRAGL